MTLAEPAPTVALKHLALSIQTGPFGSQLHAEDYSVGGRPVVNPAHLRDGRIEPDPNVAVDEETFAQLAQHELKAGDVVIGRRGELGRCAVVEADQEGWLCGTGSIRLRPNVGKLEPRWLRWLLSWSGTRDWLSLASVGTTMENVGAEIVGGMPLPMVSISAQRTVADYLDRETARLDALVAAKERVLGLLAEKRRALITRAVTRGLDLRTPLRDSGIAWLGEIPVHWQVVALRFLVDIASGATPDTGRPELWDGEIPWVSPKDMKRDEIDDAQDHVSPAALSGGALRLVEPGAVLVVVRGMILAHSFPTATTTKPVTINQDMKALRCRPMLEAQYLRDFFRGLAEHIVSLADSSAHGTRKLETEVLGRLEVCVPPLGEQQAIIAQIKNGTSRLDAIVSETERTIALLKERRAALIAAAVTGQIGIPEVAA